MIVLSQRQIAVCKLVAEGRADKQIAAELDISEETVAHHLRALYKIARVNTRVQLTLWFMFFTPERVRNLEREYQQERRKRHHTNV